MNKKTKKIFCVLLISSLTLVLILNLNLFRKIHNILHFQYDERISSVSGFCSDDSIGYLNYLKKKFDFDFNPLVINYENSVPDSNWPIYDNNLKNNPNFKILLNYPNEIFIKFHQRQNYFYSEDTFKYVKNISEIYFDLKVSSINFNSNLLIYIKGSSPENKIIIYDEILNEYVQNNQPIKLKYNSIKVNNIYNPMIIEIKGPENNKINNIKLKMKHEYDINEYDILDSYQNCHYIR